MRSREDRFYGEKNSDRQPLEKAVKKGAISRRDKEIVDQYLMEMAAVHDLSQVRVMKLTTTLLGWRANNLITSEYHAMTMPELFAAIKMLGTAINQKGREFSQNTKYDYVVILKRFLLWMLENQINPVLDEKKIRGIKPPAKNMDTHHPDEILNPDEITALIAACRHSRDRALIAVQYEAATRIGELGRLQWRDVTFDDYGAKIQITDKKTKKIRHARLTDAAASRYLAAWKADYPGTPEGEAYVFVSERGNYLTYGGLLRIFKEAASRSGVRGGKIATHIFRISRGTHLIEQGLPIANVVELMWNNQSTKQIRAYIRMSPVEQDRALLKHYGVITEEDSKRKERRLTGILCANCHTQNSPTAGYCQGCGTPLTDEAMKKRMAMQALLSNPGVLDEMVGEMHNPNRFGRR